MHIIFGVKHFVAPTFVLPAPCTHSRPGQRTGAPCEALQARVTAAESLARTAGIQPALEAPSQREIALPHGSPCMSCSCAAPSSLCRERASADVVCVAGAARAQQVLCVSMENRLALHPPATPRAAQRDQSGCSSELRESPLPNPNHCSARAGRTTLNLVHSPATHSKPFGVNSAVV